MTSIQVFACNIRSVKDPLLLPTVLNSIFSFLDIPNLRKTRLVSKFWNDESNKILQNICWTSLSSKSESDQTQKTKKLSSLLKNSLDAEKLFKKLKITCSHEEAPVLELYKLLHTYGHHVECLEFSYRSVWEELQPQSQAFIYKVLSSYSPNLRELILTLNSFSHDLHASLASPNFKFKTPFNLYRIQLVTNFYEIDDENIEFLTEILKNSPQLRELEIGGKLGESGGLNNILKEIAQLKKVTDKLKCLSITIQNTEELETLANFPFGKNLKRLRLSRNMPIMAEQTVQDDLLHFESIFEALPSSLKILDLKDFIQLPSLLANLFADDDPKPPPFLFWSDIMPIFVKNRIKLHTLKISASWLWFQEEEESFVNFDKIHLLYPGLKHLEISRCYCKDFLNKNLHLALMRWFPNLTSLHLALEQRQQLDSYHRIGQLFQCFCGFTKLRRLDILTRNTINNVQVNDVLIELANYPNLQYLSLCQVKCRCVPLCACHVPMVLDVEEINEGLLGLQHLKSIEIAYAKIADKEGFTTFAKNNEINLKMG